MTGVKRKLLAGAAATIVLAAQGTTAWTRPLPTQQQGGGPSSRALRLLSSQRSQHEQATTPAPPPASSLPPATSITKTLLEALPMDMHDPTLWRGRWAIKATNELTDDNSNVGFVSLELDHGSFKAVGQTSALLASHAVTRNGSFTVAEAAAEDGQVAAEVEFHSDKVEYHPLGLPLPAPITPSHVQDLGGKRRRVMMKVMDVDKITLVFPDTKAFYLLERVSPATQQAEAAASPSSTPAIRLLIATNILSLLASGITEGLKHEAAMLLDAITRH